MDFFSWGTTYPYTTILNENLHMYEYAQKTDQYTYKVFSSAVKEARAS